MNLPGRTLAAALAAVALAVGLAGTACDVSSNEQAAADESWIEIRGQRVALELATTPKVMARGLGLRDSLDWHRGMLFLYDEPGFYSFWMKDMRFSIDILWLLDGRIVELFPRVPFYPNDPGPSLRPRSLADSVLEVPAGYSEAHGWRIGDRAKIHLAPGASERSASATAPH